MSEEKKNTCINITVDMNDIDVYDEDQEETTVLDILKENIQWAVKNAVKEKYSEEVKRIIVQEVKLVMKNEINAIIKSTVLHLASSETKFQKQYSNEEFTLKKYVIDAFQETVEENINNRRNSLIQDLAKKTLEDLRKRYDVLFANQIVQKFAEGGMLSESYKNMILGAPNAEKGES